MKNDKDDKEFSSVLCCLRVWVRVIVIESGCVHVSIGMDFHMHNV